MPVFLFGLLICQMLRSSGQFVLVFRLTVVMSVLFAGDGWHRRCLSFRQFKKSCFLQALNQVRKYVSTRVGPGTSCCWK